MALPTNAACANTKIRKRETIVNSNAPARTQGVRRGSERPVRVTQGTLRAPVNRTSKGGERSGLNTSSQMPTGLQSPPGKWAPSS
jgi:hypothetical protein